MKLRRLLVNSVRQLLAYGGYSIIARSRFGYDVLLDIEKLSDEWDYSIKTFVDVGANEGETTLLALEKFPNAQIVAFEPHPETFRLLTTNLRHRRGVDLFNLALGVKVAVRPMYEYGSSLINSLVPDAQYAVRYGKTAKKIIINCTTLDQFCAEKDIEKIDVLKIDTEGLELEVLQGALHMLKGRAIQFVYFEFNDIHLTKGTSGGALAPIDELLRRYGYRFIASYNDFVFFQLNDPFIVSNALYALPPAVHR